MVTAERGWPGGRQGQGPFFISYTGADEAWAIWIAEVIEAAGGSARVQAWDSPAGENFVVWIAEQMAVAARTIAVCSGAYFESHWSTQEWTGALADRKVVPLRVEECSLPDVLATVGGRDLFGVEEAVARRRVLEALGLSQQVRVSERFPGGGAPRTASAVFPERLPKLFNVPSRNLRFTGHQDLFDRLRKELVSDIPVAALYGMGGVGKSQVAIEYAHRYGSSYDVVWWIEGELAALIGEQLAALASELGLPSTGQIVVDAAEAQGWLRRHSGWLLIFDNVDDPATLRPWVSDGPGHTLITSRRHDWSQFANPIEVDVFNRPDSMAFLIRRVPGIDVSVADDLAEHMGDLPLGLEQAAAYIAVTGVEANEYLERFSARRELMLRRGVDLEYGGTVGTAWTVVLDKLVATAPATVQFLELAAQLASEPISLSLFRDNPGDFDEPLHSIIAGTDPLADLDDVVSEALRYSLVRRSGDTVMMHRLVATVIRANAPPGRVEEAARSIRRLTRTRDADATVAAVRRLIEADDDELVAFGEAKLVVLGDEAVGKTSLVRALVDGQRSDPNEQKTQGVDHRIWVTPWAPVTDEKTQLNIWDFGGQEILHQTHRYFLTERCVLMIVLDRRKQDDTSAVTWLRTARHQAPHSPIIIVVNKCDTGTHNLDVDFARLQQDFTEIVGVFTASCLPDESYATVEEIMAPIRDCLKQLLTEDSRLDSVRARVPKAWVRVRDDVRDHAARSQVLSAADFVNLCQNAPTESERVTDSGEQRALLGMLHQMGVVVAHGLTPTTISLAGLTLLDPNWLTFAVYALLDYGEAEFDRDTLGERLRRDSDKASLYPNERLDYIVDLLQQPQFALAYRLPGMVDPPRYLLPEALTPTAPGAVAGWDPDSLRFRFRYQQLPRGLIPRFQVFSHVHTRPDDDRWRTGCTLLIEGCAVLVDGDLGEKRIDIHITGPRQQRHVALAVVRSAFDNVHQRMSESVPVERVPLPDRPEVDVGYVHLRTLERDEGPAHEFRPEGAQRKYPVGELLHGVRPDRVTPSPPVSPAGHAGRSADYAQIGGALGGVAGVLGAVLYLLGRGTDWPSEALLGGVAVGALVGSVLGLLLSLVLRRSEAGA